MKKKYAFLYALLLFFPLVLKAQSWTTYNSNNSGLASDDVQSIAIDAQGNKWIGTQVGLNTFNGTTWNTYNTANSGMRTNSAYTIAIDAQGNKWIGYGSYVGVSKFNGTTWTTYNNNNTNGGLINDEVRCIAVDAQDNKWFGTSEGVSMFDGTSWTAYNTSNSGLGHDVVTAIAIDAQGNKWFCHNLGVSMFDGISWTSYDGNNGLIHVMSIAIDAQGNKWFGMLYDGVSMFDGNTWTSYKVANSGLKDNWVSSIAIDAQGNKWFGSGSVQGVSKFDGNSWVNYNTLNSDLAGNNVQTITIDAQGNKWFGTSNGLSLFGCVPIVPVINANGNTLSTAAGHASYQWSLNGVAIAGATNNTYTAQASGDYTVAVTNASGCMGISEIFSFSLNGTDIGAVAAPLVEVYPNPVNKLLYITAPVAVNITLISLEGKVLLRQAKAAMLDLSKVPAGAYILKITDEKGSFIKSENLLIKGE